MKTKQTFREMESGYWFLVPAALLVAILTRSTLALMIYGVAVPAALAIFWKIRGQLTERRAVLLLLLAGLALRLGYALYTDPFIRQHDVTGTAGHKEYILQLVENGSFANSYRNQFYHPPLHHLISAGVYKLTSLFGAPEGLRWECIQMMTCLYSTVSMWLSYRLFREFNLRKGGLLVAMALVAFHPTFIIMAGSINNDILSVTLALGALLAAVRWYKRPSYGHIVAIALCIGLGMMTKLSVAMIAFAVAFLFFDKLVRCCKAKQLDTANCPDLLPPRKLMSQFGLFAAICLPLGLWWSARLVTTFGISPTYVPLLSPDSWQYVGDHSVTDRLLNFSPHQFDQVFIGWGVERSQNFCFADYYEFNPLIALLKTSMFGEYSLTIGTLFSDVVCVVLFWVNAVLVVVSLIAMVRFVVRRSDRFSLPMRIGLALVWAVIFGMYIQFCLSYPHVCTQNMRYAVPLIPLGALFLGAAVAALSDRKGKLGKPARFVTGGIYGLTGAFAACSSVMFMLLSFRK